MRFECDAVLFDIDGTLVDSTGSVERSWRTWARLYGFDGDTILETSHGRRSRDVVGDLLPGEEVRPAVDALLAIAEEDLDGVIALPGAEEALAPIPEGRRAAVTSGERRMMLARMHAAGVQVPEVFISAEDVEAGKPDPEGYRLAARRLGADPARCLVVEDAPAGIEAGLAAGARVLAAATSHPADQLMRAHTVVDDLSTCTVTATADGVVVSVGAGRQGSSSSSTREG